MATLRLSKSRLLAFRQCPKRLWLQTFRPELAEEDTGTATRLAMGARVGEVARSLHENGQLIEGTSTEEILSRTQQAMKATPKRPVYEATFSHQQVVVRADLLLPERGGYRLVEVKSSSEVKPYHLDDVAIQTWVTRHAGVNLKRIDVAHIDTGFVYPGRGNYDGLFAYMNLTREADTLAGDVPGWVKASRKTLAGDEPDIEPGDQCTDPFGCPYLSYCAPELDDLDSYPPEILPRAKALAQALRDEGYEDLRDVPEERLTNPVHRRIWKATTDGKAFLDPKAKEVLEAFSYPRYYIDFETIQFAVPIWPGTRPYQQIPFQWSCHKESKNGKLTSRAFLAEDANDPRTEFAESLLRAVGENGPIFVYNIAFERTRLKELSEALPDYRQPIDGIIERLIDLLPITRDFYYHPEMRGSWSIKKVLPTIAPDLSYDDLAVGDGGMAQEAYVEMIDAVTDEVRCQELRTALLEYCGQDTSALVRLSRFFDGPDHAVL